MLAGVSVFWGLNWPAMKIILAEMPVWWFRASCLLVGGVCLLAIAAMSGSKWRLDHDELMPIVVCAFFNVCCWHMFSAYGVSIMPAGRASIIAFTMPLWAAIFSSMLLGERIGPGKIVGLCLGLTGLAVLIGPDLLVLGETPIGPAFMVGAAVSWGLGTVLFKRGQWTTSVVALAAWQLLLSAVPVTLGAIALESVPDVSSLSSRAIVALIYLYAFPMVFCQWAYFKTVRLFPATVAAVGTLMVPVVGVFSSSLILYEQIGWREFVALALTCSSLACVMLLPALRRGGGATKAA